MITQRQYFLMIICKVDKNGRISEPNIYEVRDREHKVILATVIKANAREHIRQLTRRSQGR